MSGEVGPDACRSARRSRSARTGAPDQAVWRCRAARQVWTSNCPVRALVMSLTLFDLSQLDLDPDVTRAAPCSSSTVRRLIGIGRPVLNWILHLVDARSSALYSSTSSRAPSGSKLGKPVSSRWPSAPGRERPVGHLEDAAPLLDWLRICVVDGHGHGPPDPHIADGRIRVIRDVESGRYVTSVAPSCISNMPRAPGLDVISQVDDRPDPCPCGSCRRLPRSAGRAPGRRRPPAPGTRSRRGRDRRSRRRRTASTHRCG